MTDLAGEVTAALERSVLPSVIARGGTVSVAASAEGVVTLEVTGSPGAVFPLAARIEALIRAAVPGVSAVRFVTPGGGGGPTEGGAGAGAGVAGAGGAGAGLGGVDLAGDAQRIVDAEVNPAIAAHHGHVSVEGAADGWVRIRLEGGCQGCGLAEVTIRQGIEPLLRARLPGMTGLTDVTDHEAGTEPFYSPAKR